MDINSNFSAKLHDCSLFSDIEYHDCITSTSDRLKDLAQKGAPQGTVVIASEQTAGRGRMGRRFYSPKNAGLYMSLLLRPDSHGEDAGLLTACGAVAVFKAIRAITGTSTDIKWVNDLYYQKKKLCGILAEGQLNSQGRLAYVIVGIGINISRPTNGYSEEIDHKTIALNEIVPDRKVDIVELSAEIIRAFAQIYQALPNVDFLEIYRHQSCVLGRRVQFMKDGEVHSGKAIGIDDRAHLIITEDNGTKTVLGTGEVSLLDFGL